MPVEGVRSRSVGQSVLSSSCVSLRPAGPLRSTGVTPLRRYYWPRRLPPAPRSVISSRPRSDPIRTGGSPRSISRRSMRAAPNHPGGSESCPCSLLRSRPRASPSPKGWPPALCVTGPNRVHWLCGSHLRLGRLRHPGRPPARRPGIASGERRSVGYMSNELVHDGLLSAC